MKIEDKKKPEGKRQERNYPLLRKKMDEIVRLMFEEPKPAIKTK